MSQVTKAKTELWRGEGTDQVGAQSSGSQHFEGIRVGQGPEASAAHEDGGRA